MTANVQFVISVNAANAVTGIKAVNTAMANLGPTANANTTQAVTAFDRLDKVIGKMQSAVIGFIGAFVFRTAIRGIEDVIQAGIDFEASFNRVRRTLGGAAADFVGMSNQFREMAKVMPIAVNDINRIGESAAQLGIEKDEVVEFTKTIGQISVATTISANDAATGFARLANIMGIPIAQIKTMASAMIDLDSHSQASTQEILNFSMNIAGAGRVAGLSVAEVEALATTLASVGLKSEKAGSSISRVFYEMERAIAAPGRQLNNFAAISSMTAAQFSKAFKDDAANALLSFLHGLDNVKDSGIATVTALDDLGLKNVRIADVTVRAALANELFAQNLVIAKEGIEGAGKSLDTRYSTALETTESQLTMVKGRIHDVFISISNDLTPSVLAGAKALANFTENGLVPLAGVLLAVGGGFALLSLGSLMPFIVTVGTAALGLGPLILNMSAALLGAAELGPAFTGLVTGLQAVSVGVVAGVAALAALAYEVFNLFKAYDEWKNAETHLVEAENARSNRIMLSIADLKKHGIEIDKTGKSLDQLASEVKDAGETLAWYNSKQKEVIVTSAAHTAQVHLQSKAEEEAAAKKTAAIKKIVDSVLDQSKKDEVLYAGLQKLQSLGVSTIATMDVYGKQIEKQIKLERDEFGSVSALLQPYEDRLQLLRDINDEYKADDIVRKHDLKVAEEEFAQEESLYQLHTKILPVILQMVEARRALALVSGGSPLLPGALTQPHIPDPNFTTPGFGNIPIVDTAAAGAEKALAKVQADSLVKMTSAMDTLWRKFAEKGYASLKNIGDFASSIFSELTTTLSASFEHKLMKPLADKFGEFGQTIGDKMNKIFTGGGGGSAAASGLGSKLTGLLGSAASAGIGAAVSIGIGLLVGLFKKSGSEVNDNLVKKIQNPFTDAVEKLMTSFEDMNAVGKTTLQTAVDARGSLSVLLAHFKSDTDAYAALGAKNSIAVQGAFATIEKYWGTDLANLFDEIDSKIVALGGTAGLTTDGLEELNTALKAIDDFNKSVDSMVASVTSTSSNVDVVVAALTRLQTAGTPTGLTVTALGNSIEAMAAQMRILGIDIPPIVAEFESLAIATARLQSVESELATTRTQLASAVQAAINQNTQEIDKYTQDIAKWDTEIGNFRKSIIDAKKNLADTKFWADAYSKAIKESEDAYKNAVKTRQDTEKKIADLEISIPQQKLQIALDNATEAYNAEKTLAEKKKADLISSIENQIKTNDRNNFLSLEARDVQHKLLDDHLKDVKDAAVETLKSQAAFDAAKKALDDFNDAHKLDQIKIQEKELDNLRVALLDQIETEKDLKIAYEESQIAAKKEIDGKRQGIVDSITALQEEIAQRQLNILVANRHITALQEENTAYTNLAAVLGVATSTTEQNIIALVDHIGALEAERRELVNVTGIAGKTADIFDGLSGAIIGLANAANASALSIIAATQAIIIKNPGGIKPVVLPPTDQSSLTGFGGLNTGVGQLGNGGGIIAGPFGPNGNLHPYASGIDYVPYDQMAYVHKGERIVPASQNHNSSMSINFGSVVINAQPGQDGHKIAEQFVDELSRNGTLRNRLKRVTGVKN